MNIDHPTTRFIYSLKEIKARYHELKQVLTDKTIYYSVKPNPHEEILRFIASLGLRAEVSSLGELDAALKAGFEPSLIVYGGPGKTFADIYSAAEQGVRYFSLESLTELERLARVEELTGNALNRILRIFSPGKSGRLNMMMPNSKFGITPDEVRRYISEHDVAVYGIHIYNGTQVDENNFRASIYQTNKLAEEIESIIGYRLQYVNYGGGLAWPFMQSGMSPISSETVAGVLTDVEACFEFGRYLVASCGTFETEVLDVKERDGQQILIVSAGVNILNGLSASGRLMRHQPGFYVAEGKHGEALLPTAIYGPLCTPADYFTLDTSLPRLCPGDVLKLPNCGAYAANTGLANFLLRKPAEEMIVD
ncbi:hypothetical protein BHU62_21365 [Serratia marcescens]|uniref:Orn/DAP/Arg decarboxylase 2 N-terminal domain-containing protein n=1 Tax=Serratia marcescens TaxID=615 RepID=A0A1Q4NUW4_SERMA|nr:hypothetical protein [Serratia marcescens]OKB64690.1 hypothetical protein BHU62_21365 [Serratia marcescens]